MKVWDIYKYVKCSLPLFFITAAKTILSILSFKIFLYAQICLFTYLFVYFICVYTSTQIHMCHGMHLQVRGQLVGVSFFPSTTWNPGMESGFQAWQQVPLSTGVSHQVQNVFLFLNLAFNFFSCSLNIFYLFVLVYLLIYS